MSSIDIYKYFIDIKLDGIAKLNDSCVNNVSALNKIIRIFKEYYVAQDNYSKAISKTNGNLAQISNNKSDCFHPIIEAFSTAFCVFTNVQKEFTNSLNIIIKSLTTALENNEENLLNVLNHNDESVITNFKNAQSQLDKARQKYHLICSSNNGDRSDKVLKRVKDNYEAIIIKYNKLRENFFNVMYDGFDRSMQYQLRHLETMRRCLKNVGNALSKLIFDMRDSVDSLKNFYRSNPKEDLFQLWVDSNKTVDDVLIEVFPEAVFEIYDSSTTDTNTVAADLPTAVSTTPEMKLKKLFQPRRNTTNLPNGSTSNEPDVPSTFYRIVGTNNSKKSEKINNSATKNTKRRWSGFTILKKFQSAGDLANAPDMKQTLDENCWQSRTNLDESVAIDDEGFIIRDLNTDTADRFSQSSSSTSSPRNALKGIKVNIKPVNNSAVNIASKSEVITAAMQLPLPRRENLSSLQTRRVSNLHRCSRPVSELSRDKFHKRSSSVSELRCVEKDSKSPIRPDSNLSNQECTVIPIASAMTEIVSSNDGGYTCSIQGQLVLALPMFIKDHFMSSTSNTESYSISFELVSREYEFLSAQILKKYQDVARLELINANKYTLTILRGLFQRISTDLSLSTSGNRISFPLLEYSINVNENEEEFIECDKEWCEIGESVVQFNFNISSRYLEDNKFIKVKCQLLTDGTIEISTPDRDMVPETRNERFVTVNFSKNDHGASVIINSNTSPIIRLKLTYEFVLDSFSLVMPNLILKSSKELNTAFKISLMHYRTISTGNFSQLFDYNIS